MLKLLAYVPVVVLAVASNTFGTKFLEDNKVKDGVVTLPSGLQYKVLRRGTGHYHPTVDSPCSCHYEGRIAENFPSGQKFDSSYDRGQPTTFAPNQVIKGWTIAMQLMVEGDKWEMYIPSDLGYGDRGHPPNIPSGAVLVFTMEIIKIAGDKIPAEVKPSDTQVSSAVSPLRVVFDVANLIEEPSEASFTLEVHPDWAPKGAQRFKELVEANFFENVRFFRVIDNFMAQFGIHGDPSVMNKWKNKNIQDDPKHAGIGNTRGRVSFAMAGPNTRSTQFFISFKDNSFLDNMGFTPIAEVVEGMDVVDRIFKVGEGAPSGPGPSQGEIQAKGNAYLNEKFPRLSYVKSCRFAATEGGSESSKSEGIEIVDKPSESTVQDFGEGLKLAVTRAGDGSTFPHPGDRLSMHYTLTLAGDTSGKVIDSSRSRNEPFTFTIGRGEVIDGWDKGLMKMSLGQKGVLTVPSELGYGASGAGSDIPPNADLSFDLEVLAIGDNTVAADPGSSSGFSPVVAIAIVLIGMLLLYLLCPALSGRRDKGARRSLEMSTKSY